MAEVMRVRNAAAAGAFSGQPGFFAACSAMRAGAMPQHGHGAEQGEQQQKLHGTHPEIIGVPACGGGTKVKD